MRTCWILLEILFESSLLCLGAVLELIAWHLRLFLSRFLHNFGFVFESKWLGKKPIESRGFRVEKRVRNYGDSLERAWDAVQLKAPHTSFLVFGLCGAGPLRAPQPRFYSFRSSVQRYKYNRVAMFNNFFPLFSIWIPMNRTYVFLFIFTLRDIYKYLEIIHNMQS